jgi:hypothetical protein
MSDRLDNQLTLQLDDAACLALEIAGKCNALRPSQYARQAVLHRLMLEKYLPHPLAEYQTPQQGK